MTKVRLRNIWYNGCHMHADLHAVCQGLRNTHTEMYIQLQPYIQVHEAKAFRGFWGQIIELNDCTSGDYPAETRSQK